MRPVVDYYLINHFDTRGTMPTGFLDVGNGVGASPADAIQNALERLAGNGWDINGLLQRILAENQWTPHSSADSAAPSCFVSIYVR